MPRVTRWDRPPRGPQPISPRHGNESFPVYAPSPSRSSRLSGGLRKSLPTTGGAPWPSLEFDPSTLDLLSVIRRSGPPYELTTREITRRTLITPGAVSQRVARAEQAGLVERSPSSVSRRAVSVRLTDTGHDLIGTTVRQLLEHESDLISALTAAERTALTGFLTTLEQTLVASPPDEPQERTPHKRSTTGRPERPLIGT